MQLKQKPNTLVCYICGREFGTKSLQIHLKSCQSKFQQEQNQKQKKDRKILPPEPPFLRQLLNGNLQNIHVYNEQAVQIHKYQILPACRFCGRTFNQESLKVHMNACPKKTNVEPPKKTYEEEVKKPRTLACCVCGRQFGLTSLKIHYPQCVEKFENQQSKKSKQQRRKTPVFSASEIELFESKVQWTNEEIQSFNSKAMSIFRDKGMIHCEICRRSFMPQPYQKHLRSCKQNNKNYKQPSADQIYTAQVEVKKPKVLMCHICGRQFGLSSLTIHQKTCKEKFLNAEKLKPKSQRKPLPSLPSDVLANFSIEEAERWGTEKIQQYNKICNEVYRNQSMTQCSICKRKFIQSAYQKHKNYCQKNNRPVNQSLKEPNIDIMKNQAKKIDEVQKKIMKQKTKEIKVENVIPQTAEQLEETVVFQSISQPAQNEKNNHLNVVNQNQQLLTPPKESSKCLNDETKKKQPAQISKQGPQLAQPKIPEPVVKNESQLIEQSLELHSCQKCGRKFLAQRLQKHISVCKGTKIIPNFKQKLNKPKDEVLDHENNYRSERVESKRQDELGSQNHSKQLVPCSKCGRRFLQNRLSKHQQCCKGKQNGKTQNQQKNEKVKQNQKKGNQLFQKKNEKQKESLPEQAQKQSAPSEMSVINNQSFQVIDVKPCSKCDRKFALDRLEVHENICKGKPKIKADPEKAKTIEVIKKTKENFFKMVQDIKSKKIRDEQIDRQLDEELQTLGNTQTYNKAGGLKNKRQNEPKQSHHEGMRSMSKQIDPDKISKWKKNHIAKKSPEKQFRKQGRTESHLPKI